MDGGGAKPAEIELRDMVNRFGAPAVLGMPAPAGVLRRIRMAEAIEAAYQSRAKSGDWVTWASENETANVYLIWAMKAASGKQG